MSTIFHDPIMSISLDYIPTKKQQLFHTSTAFEVLYGGAAGGGKSTSLVMEALVDAIEHPGVHSYLFRRSYSELRDTLIFEALQRYPREVGTYKGSCYDFVLKNGSVLHFRYCRNILDAYKYQGAEMHRLYIDELTHITRDVYDYLKTRVRAPKSLGVTPKIRCTTNPGGVGHAWVKAYYITPLVPFEIKCFGSGDDEQSRQSRQYIPATAMDNPHLNPGYLAELESKPLHLKRALLNGDWNIFEGQVFEEFADNPDGYYTHCFTHVIAPFEIPPDYQIIRGFDWGYTKPFSVGYYAKSPDGVLYRFYEIYGCEAGRPDTGLRLEPKNVASQIAAFEKEHLAGRKIYGIADPAIFDESRGAGGCISAIFAGEGVYFVPADNRRIPGKMQLHSRLAFDEHGRCGFYVFHTCKQFLRTVPSLCYSRTTPEDLDTSGEDHIYDETRYVCMAFPTKPPKRQKNIKIPVDTGYLPRFAWSSSR